VRSNFYALHQNPIPVGAALLAVKRLVRDADGRPIRLVQGCFAPIVKNTEWTSVAPAMVWPAFCIKTILPNRFGDGKPVSIEHKKQLAAYLAIATT
jgi:hypothetical protein